MTSAQQELDDADAFRAGSYDFFLRARMANVVGVPGASIVTVWLWWGEADQTRLVLFLVVHQLLAALMAIAFLSPWSNRRLTDDGLPRFATATMATTQGWCASLMWFDLEAAESLALTLSSMIVLYACAAGTMVVLGPLRRIARTTVFALLLPPTLAAFAVGHYAVGIGTLFFLAVIAVVGIDKVYESYRELIELRAISVRSADELRVQAHHDPLTGLLNRVGLSEIFEHPDRRFGAVMYIDLDRFKQVNDKAGHLAGDQLLQEVAQRLITWLPVGGLAVRLGGDEFLVLTTERRGFALEEMSGALVDLLGGPYRIDDDIHSISASIGVSTIEPGETLEMALHRSDRAMLGAKANGRGIALVYSEAVESMIDAVEIEHELRRCVDLGEFAVEGQPVYDLHTGDVAAIELLARPEFAKRLGVSPDDFIPIAERTGLIDAITIIVMRQAAEAAVAFRSMGLRRHPTVLVNVSPLSLIGNRLVERIEALYFEHDIRPGELAVEITESLSMRNVERSVTTLERLRSIGVEIALDDFGAGYSSLEQLLALPISMVKIDKAVMGYVHASDEAGRTLQAIVDLAAAVGQRTIVEGIETDEQLHAARAAGAEFGQGWLMARPAPLHALSLEPAAVAKAPSVRRPTTVA